MKPKHQLKVVLYDASSSGGVCHYTHQLAEHLAQVGLDVTLVTNEGYELCHAKKRYRTHFLFKPSWINTLLVSVIGWIKQGRINQPGKTLASMAGQQAKQAAVNQSSPFNILKTARLRITLLKAALFLVWHRPDIVHFQWLADRNNEYYFARFLKKLGFKIIYTVHDLLPQEISTATDRDVLGKIYKLVDRLIVHSLGDKTEMITLFEINANKISVIPHGSNDLFYASGEMSKDSTRRQLGIPSKEKVILFFGIIRRYKGLEYLIEAFKEVKQRVPNASLLITGAVYRGDSEGFRYYSDLLNQFRDDDSVRCITDYVPIDQVNSYFLASDVVVLPYVKTYTSGVLLTAYAAGRPVVVTDTGALKEVVEDGKSGYIVPPKDVKALVEAIVKTLSNPDRLETMSRYAKYLAERRYSWRTVAADTERVYRSSLNGVHRKGAEVLDPTDLIGPL